ncbi:hypothetical protein K457DRAFT_12951 [Linnemannia elongata AG-77]|uniref:Uncharacterized protein n=1 Tax=Linnemannia elongata AG-77 TaxID=1314771 RepID=A0A197KH98_9FUNG|nr:hypothetical protein K457DRAFT_12951 [Linnemannia elongata AG-77]
MPTNLAHTTNSDASTPCRLSSETFTSTLDQGLLAELDSGSQFSEQEAKETHPSTSDSSEVLVQVGGDQDGDVAFLDHEKPDNNAGFQADPLVTTTTRNDKNNRTTDCSQRARVTGDYSSMARNERILSYPMLSPTQSRHKQPILQVPFTAPLVLPSLARATVKLTPLSSASSHLLARRRGAAVVTTTEAPHSGSCNPLAALFEPESSGTLPRSGTPFSTGGTASHLGANAAYESDPYFPTVPVGDSLALTSTNDLGTSAPAQLPMPNHYPRPSSWYLNTPLRLAKLMKPDYFPQPAYWSDYTFRRRRSSLLSCVLPADDDEENDQGQVSLSFSDEVKDDGDSELETDLETGVIDDQSLTLLPVLSYLKADDVASRRAVEELDLSNGSEPLSAVDSINGPRFVLLTDMVQDSVGDNSFNGTPASHSSPEEWPPAEMRNLTVNFLFDIQPASPLTDAFPPLNPQADGFPTAVDDDLEPEAAAPLDLNLQALLDFLNTPARSLSLPLVIPEVKKIMTPIEVTLSANECLQSNLTELEDEEGEEERGSQPVRPWMNHKSIRADINLLKFTADYTVAAKVRDEFVETSSRLREQRLRHLAYNHRATDSDVRKEKQGKEEKEEGGKCPESDCNDLLEGLSVSLLTQTWLDDDSETVTPGSGMEGSGRSTPDVAAGEEMAIEKKEEKDEFTAKLDVMFSQLGGFLAPPSLARKERLLQGKVTHEDLPERVPEVASKSSLDLSTWTFQPGPHHTPVVNNKVVVTCESCLGQFEMSPDNLDVLERHQAESCRTPMQQKWRRVLSVTKKMTGHEKIWETVKRRGRRGAYRLSSQTVNWMMDALLGQLLLVQAFVDEDTFHADAGRLVDKEEEVVREVVQGSGYWWPALPMDGGTREGEVESEEEDEEDGDVDEIELYQWL